MRAFALVAGVVFILLGIAGFAKMLAIATMYAVVLIVAGVLFALYGATHRASLVPTRGSGRDLRDMGGV
jgi:arginine exporter protein ArgO